WLDFYSLASEGGSIYCLKNLTLDQFGECGSSQLVEGGFKRELTLTRVSEDEAVAVTVITWWDDGSQQFESKLETALRQWERE
ncbi:MAG: hypothetical protein HY381_02615, partial [Candidatus Chisholmbacteria bacterium]|nr:hypothetical protein [Candidatus Chisholmbacteria bacterium]